MTPEVTRDVCLLARMMAANVYFSQIEDLMFEVMDHAITVFVFSLLVTVKVSDNDLLFLLCLWQLSMWRCNDELRARADELHRTSKRDVKHYIGIFFFYNFIFQLLRFYYSSVRYIGHCLWDSLFKFCFYLSRKLGRENYVLYPQPC